MRIVRFFDRSLGRWNRAVGLSMASFVACWSLWANACIGQSEPQPFAWPPEPTAGYANPGYQSADDVRYAIDIPVSHFDPSDDLPKVDVPVEDELAQLRKRIESLEALAKSTKGKSDGDSKGDKKADEKKADDKKKSEPVVPSVKWTGQLQHDYYWFDQSPQNRAQFGDIQDGDAFRRARLGAFGDYGQTEYRIEMDFALSGRPTFLDVFAGIKEIPKLGSLRIGHFFEPFSLERVTPNRFLTFMERSLPDQAFVPARNNGMMLRNQYLNERATYSIGLFRTDSDAFGDGAGDGFQNAVTSRLTFLPWYDDSCDRLDYLHIGVGHSYRGAADIVTNAGTQRGVRFRSQPEARLGAIVSPNVPFFVDTNFVRALDYHLIGAEVAWIRGPWSIQSEYVGVPVNTPGQDLYFQSWYATTSFFLTGESRPYNKKIGAFDRLKPKSNFVGPQSGSLGQGTGAWEIAARVGQLDLNDQSVHGGYLTDYTAGINWHLNPYLRWTFNYVHAVNNRDGIHSRADIFGTRIGFDF